MCYSAPKLKEKEKNQTFIGMLISQFQKAYEPTKELFPDKSLLLSRGGLISEQERQKLNKVYELMASDSYVLNAKMYSSQ